MKASVINTFDKQNKTIASFDIAKFIAAIFVVLIHTQVFDGNSYWCFIGRALIHNAVPFFFCTSSYFFYKHTKIDIRHYLRRTSIFYIIYFTINLYIIYIRFFGYSNMSFKYQFFNFIKGLLFTGTFRGAWFLNASVWSILILYILRNKLHFSEFFVFAVGILFYITAVFSSGYSNLSNYSMLILKTESIISLLFNRPCSNFFVALIFFCIGNYLANHRIKGNQLYLLISIFSFFVLSLLEIYLLDKNNITGDNQDYYFTLIPLSFCCMMLTIYYSNIKICKQSKVTSCVND